MNKQIKVFYSATIYLYGSALHICGGACNISDM